MKLLHLALLFLLIAFDNAATISGGKHHHHHSPRKQKTNHHSRKLSPAYAPATAPTPPSDSIPSDPSYGPAPQPDNDTTCIFDVTEFGAVGDGSTDDTAAFRSAWKAACQVENGVVLAPSGLAFLITSTIFSGPCQPGLVFRVDGTVMPPDGPDCWPKSDSLQQWLVFYRLDGMTLTGTGTVQGNGQKWWDLPCKPHKVTNLPNLI